MFLVGRSESQTFLGFGCVLANLLQRYCTGRLAEIDFTPHTPLVYRIFVSFLAAGCPKVIIFPRENGRKGVKPFGHALGASRQKVHKYSVKASVIP